MSFFIFEVQPTHEHSLVQYDAQFGLHFLEPPLDGLHSLWHHRRIFLLLFAPMTCLPSPRHFGSGLGIGVGAMLHMQTSLQMVSQNPLHRKPPFSFLSHFILHQESFLLSRFLDWQPGGGVSTSFGTYWVGIGVGACVGASVTHAQCSASHH